MSHSIKFDEIGYTFTTLSTWSVQIHVNMKKRELCVFNQISGVSGGTVPLQLIYTPKAIFILGKGTKYMYKILGKCNTEFGPFFK